jgi:hypothetical protein
VSNELISLLMQWGMSMVLFAPPVAWLIFVVPGWL